MLQDELQVATKTACCLFKTKTAFFTILVQSGPLREISSLGSKNFARSTEKSPYRDLADTV